MKGLFHKFSLITFIICWVSLGIVCQQRGTVIDLAAASARSAYSPRHSGLEPPGGPRPLEGIPGGRSPSRTAEGGMGYHDAYGNTIQHQHPEKGTQHPERKTINRNKIPEKLPNVDSSARVWNFE